MFHAYIFFLHNKNNVTSVAFQAFGNIFQVKYFVNCISDAIFVLKRRCIKVIYVFVTFIIWVTSIIMQAVFFVIIISGYLFLAINLKLFWLVFIKLVGLSWFDDLYLTVINFHKKDTNGLWTLLGKTCTMNEISSMSLVLVTAYPNISHIFFQTALLLVSILAPCSAS